MVVCALVYMMLIFCMRFGLSVMDSRNCFQIVRYSCKSSWDISLFSALYCDG